MIPVVFLSRDPIFPMHRLCFAVIRKDMVSSSQRRNYYYEYNQR